MSCVRVGRYLVCDAFASGGMANVHFGWRLDGGADPELVAIKRVDPRIARDPELVAALEAEGRIAARVKHPNVLIANDVVALEGEIILVMDYVRGGSLAELARAAHAKGSPPPIDVIAAILVGALRGLAAAHDARDESGASLGLVHRDVSPHNVIVGVDGVARLADFGIAKLANRERTRTGQVKGKLTYLAPEQVHGAACPASDVFAMGVTAWEAFAGRPLFSAETDAEVLARVLAGAIPRVASARPDVPPLLDKALARALERSLDRRFASADAFAAAIEEATSIADGERVGAWVAETAAATIIARDAMIARAAVERDEASRGVVTAPAAQTASTTSSDVSSSEAPSRLKSRRRVALAAFFGGLLLAGGLGAWLDVRSSGVVVQGIEPAIADGDVPSSSAAPPMVALSASAASDARDVAPAIAASASSSSRAAARPRRRADCNPPFTIDAQRRKHFKPQCFE